MFTPIGVIDEYSDLCQEKIITETEQGTITKLKSVSKLDAAAQLSKLLGLDAPQQIEVTHQVELSPAWVRLQALRGNKAAIGTGLVLDGCVESINSQGDSPAPAPLSIALAPEEPEE